MRIVALVKNADHVCCRYRLAAMRPYLEGAGHQVEFRDWPRSVFSLFSLQRYLRNADAVILQRKMPPRWQLEMLKRAVRWLIFDFDDAVFIRDSFHPNGLHSEKRARRFRSIIQAADFIVAGNHFLADEARLWTYPGKVHVIPTTIDIERYEPNAIKKPAGDKQVVWIGSSSTIRGLEQLRPELEQVGIRCAHVSLKVICDRFVEFENLRVIRCPWDTSTEARELAAADIGLSWLPDDLWSLGKCGLKVLQYMAAGLPVIANAVGINKRLISHGQNGFLIDRPEELVDAVAWLSSDAELCRSMGAYGRQQVAAEFNVASAANLWTRLLNELAGPRLRTRDAS